MRQPGAGSQPAAPELNKEDTMMALVEPREEPVVGEAGARGSCPLRPEHAGATGPCMTSSRGSGDVDEDPCLQQVRTTTTAAICDGVAVTFEGGGHNCWFLASRVLLCI